MSENLKAFLAKVSADAQLIERLKAAKEYNDILTLAKELGMELTLADIEPENSELSDDELNTVSGGDESLCVCVVGGGGKADHNSKACACVMAGLGYEKGDDDVQRCYCVMGGSGQNPRY